MARHTRKEKAVSKKEDNQLAEKNQKNLTFGNYWVRTRFQTCNRESICNQDSTEFVDCKSRSEDYSYCRRDCLTSGLRGDSEKTTDASGIMSERSGIYTAGNGLITVTVTIEKYL